MFTALLFHVSQLPDYHLWCSGVLLLFPLIIHLCDLGAYLERIFAKPKKQGPYSSSLFAYALLYTFVLASLQLDWLLLFKLTIVLWVFLVTCNYILRFWLSYVEAEEIESF